MSFQGRRNRSGHGLTSFGCSIKKKTSSYNWSTEKYYISILVLVTIFLIYLTAVHNVGLAKVWLTQGLTVTRYIARLRCLWLMDLVIIQIIRIFPDYHVAWMWHLLWQFERRSWLFSNYFFIKIFVKSPISQRNFCFWNGSYLIWLNFREAGVHSGSLATLSRSGIHKSILKGWSFWENCWTLWA